MGRGENVNAPHFWSREQLTNVRDLIRCTCPLVQARGVREWSIESEKVSLEEEERRLVAGADARVLKDFKADVSQGGKDMNAKSWQLSNLGLCQF